MSRIGRRRRVRWRCRSRSSVWTSSPWSGCCATASTAACRRSTPPCARGLEIAERSVTNLLNRYDELLATNLTDTRRLRRVLKGQRGVILALDGLQPDVGHEVLWVVRDCLSGEVLLARSLLSATAKDLAPLLREVAAAVGVPVLGVVSDGQTSIRRAVERALPGVPHQLCQF